MEWTDECETSDSRWWWTWGTLECAGVMIYVGPLVLHANLLVLELEWMTKSGNLAVKVPSKWQGSTVTHKSNSGPRFDIVSLSLCFFLFFFGRRSKVFTLNEDNWSEFLDVEVRYFTVCNCSSSVPVNPRRICAESLDAFILRRFSRGMMFPSAWTSVTFFR